MRKLRLGVVGTGAVVREIYEHLYLRSRFSPGLSIEAVCDVDGASLDETAQRWRIAPERRFTDFRQMLASCDLDVVSVNTPDGLHREIAIEAMQAGVDVLLPKPLASRISDAHAMIECAGTTGRLLGVDYHKRFDPIVREARARYLSGRYGRLQTATWSMLDELQVSNPNHIPRFFGSGDFAVLNSPVSFLTSHMVDTFVFITRLRPLQVQATGYKQKLRSLTPLSVDGYDLVDTSILFEEGVSCHVVTGWALPDTAGALTVQSGRMIFTDGMVDLWREHYGYRETTAAGREQINPLFLNFEEAGIVSGYGIESPGAILSKIRAARSDEMGEEERASYISPLMLGFYATVACECATASLESGEEAWPGVVNGAPVDVRALLQDRIGESAERYYAQ